MPAGTSIAPERSSLYELRLASAANFYPGMEFAAAFATETLIHWAVELLLVPAALYAGMGSFVGQKAASSG